MRGKDILTVIFGVIIFTSALFTLFPNNTKNFNIISPLAQTLEEAGNFIKGISGKNLEEIVKKSLSGTHGSYGIVIKNLKTGEYYAQNETKAYEPASLYKLWALGATYKMIKMGKLSEDEVITRDASELNKIFGIDEADAELKEGTITMTVGDAIEQMITISHNYAALLLVSRIGNSTISAFMSEQQFRNSQLGEPPKTTPSDIALFFEKIYSGAMIDGEYSKKMIEILTRQKLNDRIPKYLPNGVEVAHKTGELNGFKHDAGIILGEEPILFIVLSESDNPAGAAERIAQLSKNVYDYFQNKR